MNSKTGKDTNQFAATGHDHALDNVVWAALCGMQRCFSVGDQKAKRYPASITPYAGIVDHTEDSLGSLRSLLSSKDDLIVLFTLEEMQRPAGFKVINRALVDQMVCRAPIEGFDARPNAAICQLTEADYTDTYALIDAISPGIFASESMKIGRYIGIRDNGNLVAVAGERMRLEGYTEISSVCVTPERRGGGLGSELIARLNNRIIARDEASFLHVFSTNTGAISLYERLGFTLRRRLHLLAIGLND